MEAIALPNMTSSLPQALVQILKRGESFEGAAFQLRIPMRRVKSGMHADD